ncbi:YEATS domain-containing protein 2-like, partial [Stegodyphus dumicola]|uniref:YEATS domain-containing protein 2-like n=1 Tax=Stegodyphus dumicola TaxID=202533 RepID=UPI0015B13139
MATKRSLDQDPEYEAIPSEIQEKRIKLMEDNVRNQTKKKIESIIKSNFEQEIAAKDAEIDAIDEHLYECRAMLDRLRACIITKYYATLGQEQMPSENSAPSIHPTVKKFLGKTPRFTNYNSTEVSSDNNENTFTNSSKVPVIENYSNSNSNDLPSSQNAEKIGLELSSSAKNDDIPTRAPRFKTKAKIIVGNISNFIPIWKREDQSTHRWMVYVRGDKDSPNIESFVKKVRFLLHPSYRPTDVIEISNPPFHLKKYGWGEFPVRVQLHFHDPRNKPVDIIHNLKLDKTFTGLQTLGAETVVELQLFKQDDKMTIPSALPFTETSSICEMHGSQRNYNLNGTNILENETSADESISFKMEMDIDSSDRSTELPACVKKEVEGDTISNDNDNISANISGDSEKQQCLISQPITANNRSVLSKIAVPSTSLNNTSVDIAPKSKVIPNGVNTTYVKCTDAEGRVLLVPQSSLLCIKSEKLNVSKSTSNMAGSNTSSCIKPISETLTNSNATLPSYILKFVPDQDSGQNQVFLIPVTEKKVQCTETNLLPKVKKEILMKSSNSLEKGRITSKGEIPIKSSKPDIDWEQELDQI